jgi:hypothetical protein
MHAIVAAGAGFLIAVLWFDLMFDIQVREHPGPELPPDVLASISAYYRRVTIDASPMGRLVSLVMAATIAAIAVQIYQGSGWRGWTSLVATSVPITLALTRIFPAARRLAAATDPTEAQSRLARAIYRDHLVCLATMVALLTLQLSAAF